VTRLEQPVLHDRERPHERHRRPGQLAEQPQTELSVGGRERDEHARGGHREEHDGSEDPLRRGDRVRMDRVVRIDEHRVRVVEPDVVVQRLHLGVVAAEAGYAYSSTSRPSGY